MSVRAHISLTKDVDDLDKADDWFQEVHESLQGKTTCTMNSTSLNCEPQIEITEVPNDG